MARGKKTDGSGRRPGSKNKATIERDRIAAEIAARTVADARATGKKLGKEVLADFMELFAGMASVYQPMPPGVVNTDPKRKPDEDKFDKYAVLAVECARKLAPYQSPTFQAIMVAPAPDATQPSKRFTLTIFEGGSPAAPLLLAPRRGNGQSS